MNFFNVRGSIFQFILYIELRLSWFGNFIEVFKIDYLYLLDDLIELLRSLVIYIGLFSLLVIELYF